MAEKIELSESECLERLTAPTIELIDIGDQSSLQRTNLHESLLQITRLSQLESAALVRQVIRNVLGKIPQSDE